MRPALLVAGWLWMCAACSPGPRWIAVAMDGELRLYAGSLQPLGSFPLPGGPRALSPNGDGNGLLAAGVTETGAGWIGWFALPDGRPLVQRSWPLAVQAVSLDREGRRAFALAFGVPGPARLAMLDAETLLPDRAVPLCSDPWPPAFSRDGDRAYVVCRPGLVIEVDPALALVLRRAVVAADSGRSCEAGPAALSSNETLLLVPCRASGRLLYLDRATLEPWDSMAVAPGISRVAPAGGGIAVVLVPDSDRALILDLRGKRRLAGVPTAPAPVEVALDAAGRRAFVLAAGRSSAAGGVLAIELPSGAVQAQADLPPGARTLAIWPGARKVRMRWTTASASGGRVAR